jgi:hypothetical protein
LIAPGVVIEELWLNTNLGVLLWRLGNSQRRIRVQEMKIEQVAAEQPSER